VTQDGMSVAEAAKLYGPVPEEKFPIPAVDIAKVDPKYYRRTVRYDTKEAPGTIIVDPGNYYVYRVEDGLFHLIAGVAVAQEAAADRDLARLLGIQRRERGKRQRGQT